MEVSLRPATQDDHDFLWWLHCHTMRSYVEQTWGWDENLQVRRFEEHFDPTAREIIECNGVAIGCISVERRNDLILLGVIEIAPEYQNQGIGTRLITDLQGEGKRQGVPVQLQVLRVNPARRLYQRLGFEIVGETETHYVMSPLKKGYLG